mmetsp:Transcript_11935/g.48075  ORF Transcript_11935/g.48075 Transcript_11935/m.48075 type:complete len:263 (-) Transcript_11935:2148-2936(-)
METTGESTCTSACTRRAKAKRKGPSTGCAAAGASRASRRSWRCSTSVTVLPHTLSTCLLTTLWSVIERHTQEKLPVRSSFLGSSWPSCTPFASLAAPFSLAGAGAGCGTASSSSSSVSSSSSMSSPSSLASPSSSSLSAASAPTSAYSSANCWHRSEVSWRSLRTASSWSSASASQPPWLTFSTAVACVSLMVTSATSTSSSSARVASLWPSSRMRLSRRAMRSPAFRCSKKGFCSGARKPVSRSRPQRKAAVLSRVLSSEE